MWDMLLAGQALVLIMSDRLINRKAVHRGGLVPMVKLVLVTYMVPTVLAGAVV